MSYNISTASNSLFCLSRSLNKAISFMKSEMLDFVVCDRDGIVENRHLIHAAVVDSTGKLLFSVGDPSRMTLSRSAAKPLQALAILETGALEQFGFDDADLALMCASHSSEDRHIDRARAMLSKVGVSEDDLRCGGHVALSDAVNRDWIEKKFIPNGISNNCSGKHAGMLAGAKALGVDFCDYHLPTHPMQLKVKDVFGSICGADPEFLKWGLDGCNLPAPAFPLTTLAKVYSLLAQATDSDERQCSSATEPKTQRIHYLSRIFHAMAAYPELVGGEDRFCTELAKLSQGALVGKLGADACYGIAIKSSERTRQLGANGAVGIAVKVEDGNVSILYSAVVEILEQLQIGTSGMPKALGHFHYPKLCNTAGVRTGHVSHQFRVQTPAENHCSKPPLGLFPSTFRVRRTRTFSGGCNGIV